MSFKAHIAALIPGSRQAYIRYWYRKAVGHLGKEMSALLDLARPGSVAIDVGANVGVYAYAFARRGARVVAFEPLPYYAECTSAIKNVIVHQVALSDHAGIESVSLPLLNGQPNPVAATLRKLDVPHVSKSVTVATLDSFALRNVSALKIDVEGHELPVIRGALQTIEREKPTLLVEIESRHTRQSVRDTILSIEVLGYAGSFVDGEGRWLTSPDFDPQTHQSAPPGTRSYVNNFLFRPL